MVSTKKIAAFALGAGAAGFAAYLLQDPQGALRFAKRLKAPINQYKKQGVIEAVEAAMQEFGPRQYREMEIQTIGPERTEQAMQATPYRPKSVSTETQAIQRDEREAQATPYVQPRTELEIQTEPISQEAIMTADIGIQRSIDARPAAIQYTSSMYHIDTQTYPDVRTMGTQWFKQIPPVVVPFQKRRMEEQLQSKTIKRIQLQPIGPIQGSIPRQLTTDEVIEQLEVKRPFRYGWKDIRRMAQDARQRARQRMLNRAKEARLIESAKQLASQQRRVVLSEEERQALEEAKKLFAARLGSGMGANPFQNQ